MLDRIGARFGTEQRDGARTAEAGDELATVEWQVHCAPGGVIVSHANL